MAPEFLLKVPRVLFQTEMWATKKTSVSPSLLFKMQKDTDSVGCRVNTLLTCMLWMQSPNA